MSFLDGHHGGCISCNKPRHSKISPPYTNSNSAVGSRHPDKANGKSCYDAHHSGCISCNEPRHAKISPSYTILHSAVERCKHPRPAHSAFRPMVRPPTSNAMHRKHRHTETLRTKKKNGTKNPTMRTNKKNMSTAMRVQVKNTKGSCQPRATIVMQLA